MSFPLLAVAAVVGCGISSAGFDFLQKLLVRRISPVPLVFLLALASTPLFAAAVLLGGGVEVAAGYLPPAVVSLLLNLLGHITFIQAVRSAPLSLTVPLLSLTPAFTALLGFVLLGEVIGPVVMAGILLVVSGAYALNAWGDETRSLGALVLQPGAWLMVLTAFLWSVTVPLDKMAIARSGPAFHGLFLTAGMMLGAFVVLVARGRLGELRHVSANPGLFVLALIACTLALGLQLVSLQLLLVSVVETVKRGLGNVIAVLLGRLFFAEAVTFRKLGAAIAMAVGVALILL